MVKIYTKTGDRGTTSLFGGRRVEKDSPRIEAYGQVDELNSLIGAVLSDDLFSSLRGAKRRSNLKTKKDRFAALAMTKELNDMAKRLLRIQSELFVLGADLSAPLDVSAKGLKVPRIAKGHIKRLEEEIDSWSEKLPKLRNFILPGGNKVGSKLHLARSTARRAERAIVSLAAQDKINQNALIYINRLSDWFFVAARYANRLDKIPETIWKGRTGQNKR